MDNQHFYKDLRDFADANESVEKIKRRKNTAEQQHGHWEVAMLRPITFHCVGDRISAGLSCIGPTFIGDRVYRNSDLCCTLANVALTCARESLMFAVTGFLFPP